MPKSFGYKESFTCFIYTLILCNSTQLAIKSSNITVLNKNVFNKNTWKVATKLSFHPICVFFNNLFFFSQVGDVLVGHNITYLYWEIELMSQFERNIVTL